MRTFWMAFCNDGVELTGIERDTRAEAIKDCKEAFRFDFAECGGDPEFDYYIEKYCETDDETRVLDMEFFAMSMGKRGGVTAKKTRAI